MYCSVSFFLFSQTIFFIFVHRSKAEKKNRRQNKKEKLKSFPNGTEKSPTQTQKEGIASPPMHLHTIETKAPKSGKNGQVFSLNKKQEKEKKAVQKEPKRGLFSFPFLFPFFLLLLVLSERDHIIVEFRLSRSETMELWSNRSCPQERVCLLPPRSLAGPGKRITPRRKPKPAPRCGGREARRACVIAQVKSPTLVTDARSLRLRVGSNIPVPTKVLNHTYVCDINTSGYVNCVQNVKWTAHNLHTPTLT